MSRWEYSVPGIDDSLFIRGDVPMTKSEVRAITLSKLKVKDGIRFLDIGAGTGSVSVEAALLGCRVTSIERKKEGLDLIKKNFKAFGIEDYILINGSAPKDLDKAEFDRVFIGGSGGNLKEIFSYLESSVSVGGIVVANTVTIENTGKIVKLFKKYRYELDITTVNISRSKNIGTLHMLQAENPVTIIRGVKKSDKR